MHKDLARPELGEPTFLQNLVECYSPKDHFVLPCPDFNGKWCCAVGVKFKDWKAKECDKCKGTAGEFEIVGTCEDETSSCKGQKKTKMSTDCATYCPSNAGKFQSFYQ